MNEPIVLNYSLSQPDQVKLTIDPETIPNMVPAKVLSQWQEGDTQPYYKVQKIDYPIVANNKTYHESFFESYISKLKDRPIPGSKDGHEIMWGKRPTTDFIMVGAKIEKNGDGTGSVYFKNYIPPKGEKGSNEIFIRENKSDMVHYSLVANVKINREVDGDGNEIENVIESVMGERNDAVEWGTGAMKQVTNKNDSELASSLIEANNDSVADNKKNQNKVENMSYNELVQKLNALKSNGEVEVKNIAKDLGLELVAKPHTEALKVINAFNDMGIEDPVKAFNELQDKIKADQTLVFNSKLDSEFGKLEKDANGNEKNLLRSYAEKMVANKSGKELDGAIVELKNNDPIAKQLAAQKADYTSDENVIGIHEGSKVTNSVSDKKVDKV